MQQWAENPGDNNGTGSTTGASREGDSAPDLTSSSQRKDSVRIVDVNEDKAAVSMHVPGLGVRPFLFNRLGLRSLSLSLSTGPSYVCALHVCMYVMYVCIM